MRFRFRRSNAELEVQMRDEMRFHLQMEAERLGREEGLHPDEARRQAYARFGGLEKYTEEGRAARGPRLAESVLRDLRYALRQLRLNPGFTAVALLSLALGIGANAAMFQLLNAVRLKPLPVARPSELALVTRAPNFYSSGWSAGRNETFTFAQFEELSRRQQAFSGMLAFNPRAFNLNEGGKVRLAQGLYVSPNFLEVLGVRPKLGAWPASADVRDCSREGVLLSDGFWRREFGGDPAVIGKTMALDGRRLPIHAVAPASFFGVEPGYRFDVAVPLCADGARDGTRRLTLKWAWWLTLMGRLNPGWTVERAARHLFEISPAVFQDTLPDTYPPAGQAAYLKNRLAVASGEAGVSSVRQRYEGALWILLGMTGLVLLIACANLANLLLARAAVREREAVLRQALGASRARLIRQLMCESGLIAIGGAMAGAWVAQALSRALVAFFGGPDGGIYLSMDVDWRVLGFTTALAVGTCALFGLGPALGATRGTPAAVMHGGRGPSALAARHTLRRGLVVSQIALSFVLLAGALLFGRSLRNLETLDTGMATDGVLTATITTDADEARRRPLFDAIEDRVRRLPDVAAAAMVTLYPFSGSEWNEEVYVGSPERAAISWLNRVSPRYFETMGTALTAGRDFTADDREGTPEVAIVNQEFVRKYFGGTNPIGQQFMYQADNNSQDPAFTIVGVVGDTKYLRLREQPRPIAYLPVAQEAPMSDSLTVVLRARGDMGRALASVEREVAAVDPRLLVEFRTLDSRIADSLLRERLVANLSGGFGVLAIVLATLGLYGVMSYLIACRRPEIGVRMALGARRGDILRQVLGESGRLVAIGLLLGVAGAVLSLRFAESLLFNLAPTDAPSFVIAAAAIAATAFAAALVPARRAANTDAAVILRGE